MNCATCNKPLPTNGDVVSCSHCSRDYHFDDCCGLAANTWSAKSLAEKNKWRCKNCRASVVTRSKSEREEKSTMDVSSDLKQGFAMIKESLEKMFNEQFNSMKAQLKQFENSIEDNNRKMVGLSEMFIGLKTDMASILEENNKIKETQTALKKELLDLQMQIHMMDQYSRNRNLEIHGIPPSKDENLDNLLQQLFKKLKVQVTTKEYVAHRLPPKRDGSQPILVQFESRYLKNQVLKEGKNVKPNLKDLQPNSPESPVYLNENLNMYFRKLLFEIKKTNKQKGYVYIWYNNSKILVKKSQGSKTIWIKSLSDFEALD
jgi:hypothetical protein